MKIHFTFLNLRNHCFKHLSDNIIYIEIHPHSSYLLNS